MGSADFNIYHNLQARKRGAYPFVRFFGIDGARVARDAISACPHYAATPLHLMPGAAMRAGVASVTYKDEASRFGLGSFKALGGAYAVGMVLVEHLSALLGRDVALSEIARGDHRALTSDIVVACASDGNHGRSVAAGAKAFHCGCVIFLHEGVSSGRQKSIEALGAKVLRTLGVYDDSVRAARNTARDEGWIIISDTAETDDPADLRIPFLIMQGYRLLAAEILDELVNIGQPLPTHVFLQGGVGGLAAAIVVHFWEVLGPSEAPVFVVVEPERAECLFRSAMAGAPTPAMGDLDTIMAGLSCGEVSRAAWPILQAGVEFFMTISDSKAIEAMILLANGSLGAAPVIAGESAVAGLAALLALAEAKSAGSVALGPNSHVLVIGTEGATDPEIYQKLVGKPAFYEAETCL